MSTTHLAPSVELAPRSFRRQWHRLIIPSLFATVSFGLFAWRVPDGVGFAVPALGLFLAVCTLLHGGIVLTRNGIEWHLLHPRWVYRTIPWEAVREVRPSWFGRHRIRLIVESGRYEPWVWGTPRPGQTLDHEIWTRGYRDGGAMWDAIHDYRASREPGAERTSM